MSKPAVLETKQRLFQVYSAVAEWNQQEIAWNQDEWIREGVARKGFQVRSSPSEYCLNGYGYVVHFCTEKLCTGRTGNQSKDIARLFAGK